MSATTFHIPDMTCIVRKPCAAHLRMRFPVRQWPLISMPTS